MPDDEGKLLSGLLATETKAELLGPFHRNPGLVDTVDAIARRIGRTGPQNSRRRESLRGARALRARKVGTLKAMMLSHQRDREIQNSLEACFRRIAVRAYGSLGTGTVARASASRDSGVTSPVMASAVRNALCCST